ncbi:MAG: hypothetical protein ACYDHZ_08100 [Dehalococcoidia bacterium]
MVLPWWARWAAIAALAVAIFVYGDIHGHKAEQTKALAEKLDIQQKTTAAILAADAKGNRLTAQLQDTQATIDRLKQEKRHALAALTDNRACLTAPAIKLLNSPGTNPVLPPAAPGAAQKDGPGLAASDRDVADWSIEARALYAVCAAQLNALIDFLK